MVIHSVPVRGSKVDQDHFQAGSACSGRKKLEKYGEGLAGFKLTESADFKIRKVCSLVCSTPGSARGSGLGEALLSLHYLFPDPVCPLFVLAATNILPCRVSPYRFFSLGHWGCVDSLEPLLAALDRLSAVAQPVTTY